MTNNFPLQARIHQAWKRLKTSCAKLSSTWGNYARSSYLTNLVNSVCEPVYFSLVAQWFGLTENEIGLQVLIKFDSDKEMFQFTFAALPRFIYALPRLSLTLPWLICTLPQFICVLHWLIRAVPSVSMRYPSLSGCCPSFTSER